MSELIQYLESNGIQYEAIPMSHTVDFVIVFCAVFAFAAALTFFLWDRKLNGKLTKNGVCLILFAVVMFSIPGIAAYMLRDKPETVIIHCTDEQFVELFKMGYKLRLGDNTNEWVCYGCEK